MAIDPLELNSPSSKIWTSHILLLSLLFFLFRQFCKYKIHVQCFGGMEMESSWKIWKFSLVFWHRRRGFVDKVTQKSCRSSKNDKYDVVLKSGHGGSHQKMNKMDISKDFCLQVLKRRDCPSKRVLHRWICLSRQAII